MDIRKASLVKFLRELLITTACRSQKKLTQATDIQDEVTKMSINLPYVEGTCEKPQRILRSHKIRSNFHTGKTLRKLLCKPKDRVATEHKNKIVYQIVLITVKQSTSVNLNGP